MTTSQFTVNEYRNLKVEEKYGYPAYAMFLMIETRDPYTATHQRRVAQLAAAVAKEMGLLKEDVATIHIAGILHDIGKLVVPIEILNKPEKLNQYEFNLIQSHASIGFGLLDKVGFPRSVTRAILQHHERLNGSGYPEGLSGENIIPQAKILAVADVVEAMASCRPYRPALGLGCALEEINQHKGTLYDTEVVETFFALFQNNEPEFQRVLESQSLPV